MPVNTGLTVVLLRHSYNNDLVHRVGSLFLGRLRSEGIIQFNEPVSIVLVPEGHYCGQ